MVALNFIVKYLLMLLLLLVSVIQCALLAVEFLYQTLLTRLNTGVHSNNIGLNSDERRQEEVEEIERQLLAAVNLAAEIPSPNRTDLANVLKLLRQLYDMEETEGNALPIAEKIASIIATIAEKFPGTTPSHFHLRVCWVLHKVTSKLPSSQLSEMARSDLVMNFLIQRSNTFLVGILSVFSPDDRSIVIVKHEKRLVIYLLESRPFDITQSGRRVESWVVDFMLMNPIIIDRIAREISHNYYEDADGNRVYYEQDKFCMIAVALLSACLDDDAKLQQMLGHGLLLAANHLCTVSSGDQYFHLFQRILTRHPQCRAQFAEITVEGRQGNRLADYGRTMLFQEKIKADYVWEEECDGF